MQENNNKKTLILSVLGVLVLIVAVVGVSFAMYSFSAAGTRTNVISTGSVSIDFSDDDGTCLKDGEYVEAATTADCTTAGGEWYSAGNFVLTGQYPKTDARGLADATTVAFSVVADYPGSDMLVDYALKFVDVTESNLKASNVKLQIIKNVNGTESYVMGTETTGALLSSEASSQATSTLAVAATVNTKDTNNNYYVFDEGTFNSKGSISYQVKAWVDENFELYSASTDSTATCSDTSKTTAAACEAAGATWTQTKATTAQTLKFKIQVVGAQRVS